MFIANCTFGALPVTSGFMFIILLNMTWVMAGCWLSFWWLIMSAEGGLSADIQYIYNGHRWKQKVNHWCVSMLCLWCDECCHCQRSYLSWCSEWICADPDGFNAKRRKTAEQSYTSFITDVSHLPKPLSLFNSGKCCLSALHLSKNVTQKVNYVML